MILDPNPPADSFPAAWAVAFGEDQYGLWQAFEVNEVRQVMRWIPPGVFIMGSPEDEKGRGDNERQHQVTISKGYWLADTACTQALWEALMGENPSYFSKNQENPVERVSWDDCQKFLEKLREQIPQLKACLPTEAQWEYACRAGSTAPFSWGHSLSPEQANYNGNYPYANGEKGEYREKTLPVLTFDANPWGLFQMHGNVYEWCQDWFGDYPQGQVIDPLGPSQGRYRVLRGGSWRHSGDRLRSAYRLDFEAVKRFHGYGLRVAGG